MRSFRSQRLGAEHQKPVSVIKIAVGKKSIIRNYKNDFIALPVKTCMGGICCPELFCINCDGVVIFSRCACLYLNEHRR